MALSTNERRVDLSEALEFEPQGPFHFEWRKFIVPFWEKCVHYFGLLLIPAMGYLMLEAGVADPVMVTALGILVMTSSFGLRKVLEWQQTRHVQLDGEYEATLHTGSHETLEKNLKSLIERLQATRWTDKYLDRITYTKENWLGERFRHLKTIYKNTVKALDYKRSHQSESEAALQKQNLDLANLETQLRSIGWAVQGLGTIGQRLFQVRYHYWFHFASSLKLWSGVALVLIVPMWLFEVTSVVQAQRNPQEVYTLGFYGLVLFLSWLISRMFARS